MRVRNRNRNKNTKFLKQDCTGKVRSIPVWARRQRVTGTDPRLWGSLLEGWRVYDMASCSSLLANIATKSCCPRTHSHDSESLFMGPVSQLLELPVAKANFQVQKEVSMCAEKTYQSSAMSIIQKKTRNEQISYCPIWGRTFGSPLQISAWHPRMPSEHLFKVKSKKLSKNQFFLGRGWVWALIPWSQVAYLSNTWQYRNCFGSKQFLA